MLRATLIAAVLTGCSDYDFTKRHTVDEPRLDTGTPEPYAGPTTQTHVDTFQIDQKTDVLVFGDTSGSMEVELLTLADNVGVFVDRLAELVVDWQLMAVTGPDGCAQQGVLTAADGDYRERFAAGITTPPGVDLVDEWGLYNSMIALENTGIDGCNSGFLREDALLHVVIISDEDDNSPGYEDGGDYWKDYVLAMQAIKGDAWKVHLSFVGGAVPDGCDGAEPGYGYWEAVQFTEGEFISICDDWASQLSVLADISASQSTFSLSHDPILASLRLFVNSEERTDGWSFRESDNAIHFDENAPWSGDIVKVAYDSASP